MNTFQNFSLSSRIWIYQSNRELTSEEANEISQIAGQFTEQWTAHQQLLKTAFDLRYNLFLIFCVDESTAASGCSIDKSLHLVQQLEKKFNIRLLNRQMGAYFSEGEAIPFSLLKINDLYQSAIINDQTTVADNLVNTLGDFNARWQIPFHQSWMKQFIKAPVAENKNA